MHKAYFTKIDPSTTFKDLAEFSKNQIQKNRTAEEFREIVNISLSERSFNVLEQNIYDYNEPYLRFSNESISDSTGRLQCIVISNNSNTKKLALYTAGRTFPLYGACIEQ